jgi:hypothetical protein
MLWFCKFSPVIEENIVGVGLFFMFAFLGTDCKNFICNWNDFLTYETHYFLDALW